jgi:hypothetical protein
MASQSTGPSKYPSQVTDEVVLRIRFRLFTVTDPDPTFHFDADPDTAFHFYAFLDVLYTAPHQSNANM